VGGVGRPSGYPHERRYGLASHLSKPGDRRLLSLRSKQTPVAARCAGHARGPGTTRPPRTTAWRKGDQHTAAITLAQRAGRRARRGPLAAGLCECRARRPQGAAASPGVPGTWPPPQVHACRPRSMSMAATRNRSARVAFGRWKNGGCCVVVTGTDSSQERAGGPLFTRQTMTAKRGGTFANGGRLGAPRLRRALTSSQRCFHIETSEDGKPLRYDPGRNCYR